jgi:hypothetical protein
MDDLRAMENLPGDNLEVTGNSPGDLPTAD